MACLYVAGGGGGGLSYGGSGTMQVVVGGECSRHEPTMSVPPPPLPPSPTPLSSREVPQSCPYCSKQISNFYNLKKHIATMHQNPTVYQACTHCTAAFRTPEYLRKHLVNVHKYPVKKKK